MELCAFSLFVCGTVLIEDPGRMKYKKTRDDEEGLLDDGFWWEAIGPTFCAMELRRMERASYGQVATGVGRPLICLLVFLCVATFAMNLLTDGSHPGLLKVHESRACIDTIANIQVPLNGMHETTALAVDKRNPVDVLECGVAASLTDECSHLYMWPKNNDTSGCICCKNAQAEVREDALYDTYIVWFTSSKQQMPGAFHVLRTIVLIVAIVGTSLAGIWFLACLCKEEGVEWRTLITVETFVVGLWFAWAQLEPNPRPMQWSQKQYGWAPTQKEWITFISFITIIVVTTIIYILFDTLLPRILRCMLKPQGDFNLHGWWYAVRPESAPLLEADPMSPGGKILRLTCSYRPSGWIQFCRRRSFSYNGPCNEYGQPHGFGEWHDDSYYGENLKGYFSEGLLGGPFTGRQTGTGVIFQQKAIAYVASREDCPKGNLGSASCFFKYSEPRCGVALVECSVAGGFFPFYPRVSMEFEQVDEDDIGGMLDFYLTTCYEQNKLSEASTVGGAGREMEALVFVHGFMCELSTALEKLALTTMLGKMPYHIVPIIFGWSSGGVPVFFTIKNHSLVYAKDFVSFFARLGQHFQKVHIFAHSMGCQVWCRNFPDIAGELFLPCMHNSQTGERSFSSRTASDRRLQIQSLILLNAETTVDELQTCAGPMATYAKGVTLYVDRKDIANLASQVFSSIMPASWQTWRQSESVYRTRVVGRAISTYSVQVSPAGADLVGPVMAEVYGDDTFDDEEADGISPGGKTRILKDIIEVIDCSNLDYNAGLSRHNYYAINSLMVEDICELVGKGIRAKERAHLVRRDEGIFDFLAAPALVTM